MNKNTGREYPTTIGGVATIIAHDAENGTYTSESGCLWQLVGGAMKPVYTDEFLAEEARNRLEAGL